MINNSKIYEQDLIMSIKHIIDLKKLKQSTILITGATGTVGSFLVDMLAEYNKFESADIKIYAASRNLERLADCFDSIKEYGITYIKYDLFEPIDFPFSVDYVIHAAGNAFPSVFTQNPVETLYGTIYGTYNILDFAKKTKVKKVLYISSGEVYGQGDVSMPSYKENYGGYVDPVSPRSCYPNGKRTAETLCASFIQEYGLNCVIARLCHTYGPTITKNDNRANVQFFRNVLNGEDIKLKSAASQLRSYNYIADCASAVLSVLTKGKNGEAYNIANKHSQCTIAEFANIVAAVSGQKVLFTEPDKVDKSNQSPIAKQVLNTEKLELLGWKGCFSVEEGISHTIKIMQGK